MRGRTNKVVCIPHNPLASCRRDSTEIDTCSSTQNCVSKTELMAQFRNLHSPTAGRMTRVQHSVTRIPCKPLQPHDLLPCYDMLCYDMMRYTPFPHDMPRDGQKPTHAVTTPSTHTPFKPPSCPLKRPAPNLKHHLTINNSLP